MNTQEQARPLEPCPFCGARMYLDYDVKQSMFGPEGNHSCLLRNIDLHDWADKFKAIDDWNTRHVETRARELLPSFKDAWAKKVVEGYHYGGDALENVAFGYEIARKELAAALTAPVSEGS